MRTRDSLRDPSRIPGVGNGSRFCRPQRRIPGKVARQDHPGSCSNSLRVANESTRFLWNIDQERQLDGLRRQVDAGRFELDSSAVPRKLLELTQQNAELRFRLAMLVRLLIANGVISAQDYAALIAESQVRKAGVSEQVDPSHD